MLSDRIKIGREPNTEHAVYLMKSGQLVCGAYTYKGKMTKDYQGLFEAIWDMVDRKAIEDELDVSGYRYWNALNIYEELIATTWKKELKAEVLHDLSIETQIHLMVQPVKAEFMRAISRAWRKAFKNSKSDDPNRPTQAWHLCRKL